MKNPQVAIGLLSLFAGLAMAQTPIKVLNPGFADGTNPNATGWTSVNGAGTNAAPCNYAETVPNIGNRTMQIKSDGGNYIQQTLTATAVDAPVNASSFGTWSISFLKGYRRDAVRNGDHVLRVSLWNTTTDSELAGSDLTIGDPGSTGTNSLSPSTVMLSYDHTAGTLAGAGIALRITSTSGDLAGSSWQRTAIVDDVSIVAGVIDPRLEVAAVPPFNNNGAAATYTVGFSNQGATQNLVVSGVTVEGEQASYFTVNSFTASTAPGATGQIQVGFSPDASGIYAADLVITSNSSGTPAVTVPISVTVVDPVIALGSSTVDFGSLPANPGLQTANLVVTNNGGASELSLYDVQLIGVGGNGFSVVSVPDPLAPGSSGNIVISFNPGASGGDFADMLRIASSSAVTPEIYIPVKAKTAFASSAKPVRLVNGNFDAGAWNSSAGTAPQGWTSSLIAPPLGGNYGQGGGTAANQTPNLASIAAHLQSVGGYYQQNLTENNAGLSAASTGTATVSFDCGYRNDASTAGPILLRVSLYDAANDLEIVGREVAIADPGVLTGTASNQLTPVALHLSYPSTGTEPLALRIAQLEPRLTVNIWRATAIIDNVSVSVAGSWEPPANAYAGWALESGLDGTPGKEDGPDEDPDGDSRTNLEEFALGGNPLSGGSPGLVAQAIADTGSDSLNEMILTLAVRTGATFEGASASIDGVTYLIQGSGNLSDFDSPVQGPLSTPVIPALLPASAPAGYRYVSFRLAASNGLPGRGFLRAVIRGE